MRPNPKMGSERQVSWRDRPLFTVATGNDLLGCSPAQVYSLAHQSSLKLRRLAGRTLVTTDAIALLNTALLWAAKIPAAAADKARKEQSSSNRCRRFT